MVWRASVENHVTFFSQHLVDAVSGSATKVQRYSEALVPVGCCDGHMQRLRVRLAYFDTPASIAQWTDQIAHTFFRKQSAPKRNAVVGGRFWNKPTMFLIGILFDQFQLHLDVSLQSSLLPE